MGNKWARMATQLPGRTDNEIKNYWNTRVKRRQRQGLPLYPSDIQPLYSQHQHRHRHRHSQPPAPTPSTPPPPTASTSSNFSFQTPIMSLHNTFMSSSPLHPLHIPHRPPPQNFFNNPYPTATRALYSPNSASTPPPLPSPSVCSTPPNYSPLQSPHQQPPFPSLPLFGYPTSNTTTAAAAQSGDGFFHNHKRFKHDESQSNNSNSFMFSHMPHYSNRSTTTFHHPIMDSRFFYPLKTELHSSQINDDGLLENMLKEAQVMAAGNKETQKEMNTTSTTQNDKEEEEEEEEEDYSRLINYDGPSSMGMAINEWCNDSGESSERQPSVITDNENHLAIDMHHLSSLFPVDISPNNAARSSSDRSWNNFPGIC